MKTLAVLAILTAAILADAGIKPYSAAKKAVNPDYSEYYASNGSKIAENDAFMELVKGSQVYKCVLQEASMNVSGRGAGMKNVPSKK